MNWIFLIGAIITEAVATLALRMASQKGATKKWFVLVTAGYVTAFVLATWALSGGLTIGVVYGVWSACGVALIAVVSRILFNEPLTKIMGVGIVLIAAGVLFIELGSTVPH